MDVPDPDSTVSGAELTTTTTTTPVTTTATTTNAATTGATAMTGNTTPTGTATTTDTATTAGTATAATSDASTGPGLCVDPARTPAEVDKTDAGKCCYFPTNVVVVFDQDGVAIDFHFEDGTALPADSSDCLIELFADHCYPSAAGQSVPIACHYWIA
jgi:hypothetical protein